MLALGQNISMTMMFKLGLVMIMKFKMKMLLYLCQNQVQEAMLKVLLLILNKWMMV